MTARPRTCDAETLLPLSLYAAVIQMTGVDWEYIEETAMCFTEAGHDGPHHGLVVELDGPTTGAVWALWESTGALLIEVLPDCPESSAEGDGCAYYLDHEGGHSWDVYDPRQALARGQLARVLAERGITLPRSP